MGALNCPNIQIAQPTDEESGYVITLSPEHHILHKGGAYSVTSVLSNLNGGASTYIEIITPPNIEVSTQNYNILSDQMIRSDFYESPTITDGTVEIPLIQRNRRKTDIPLTKFYNNPTNVSGGTWLRTLIFGASSGNGASARPITPTGSDALGFNLGQNKKYYIKLTNMSSNTATTVLFFNIMIFEFGY